MKEPEYYNSRKNKTLKLLKRIFCSKLERNLNITVLKKKFQNLLIFYLILFLTNLINITLYANLQAGIYEQSTLNLLKRQKNLKRNSTKQNFEREKIISKISYSSGNKNFKRILEYQNNSAKEDITKNKEKIYQRSIINNIIEIYLLIFFIKIIITFGFVIFYYFNYKKVFGFYNNSCFQIKSCFNDSLWEENKYFEKNENSLFKSKIQIDYNNKILDNQTDMKFQNQKFNNFKFTNKESQFIFRLRKKMLISKIKLIKCISFFNSFELTFQFFMFVNWLKNYHLNSTSVDFFIFLYFLPLLYASIFCGYFIFFDSHNRYYFLTNIINVLLFGIFELINFTKILFFHNVILLIQFWIFFYYVLKKINDKENKMKFNPTNFKTNQGKSVGEEKFYNHDGCLVVNLKQDKGEIIGKEYKHFFLHKLFDNNLLEKIVNFPRKFDEKKKFELINLKFISIKNNKYKLSKKIENYKCSKTIKEKNNTIIENPLSFKINKNFTRDENQNLKNSENKINMTKFEFNLKFNDNLNLNHFESEKPNIYLIKKFISNNISLFKILVEINDFNFNLSQELIDIYIKIRKKLKKKKNPYNSDFLFDNYMINKCKNNHDTIHKKNNKPSKENLKIKHENKLDNRLFDESKNKPKIPYEIDLQIIPTDNNLDKNNSYAPFNFSENPFEVFNDKKLIREFNLNNHFIEEEDNNREDFNQNFEQTLFKNLIIFCELLCEEVIKGNRPIFLGNIKIKNEISNNDNTCYAINVNITENKNFLLLTINDIQEEVKFVEMKTDYKFKNIYLKKFCHEFKNPVLNILQLTKNFTHSLKTISKDNFSSLSNNNQFSKRNSFFSNLSNHLKERKTLFKNSTKNFSEKQFNKSSRSNMSVVGEEFNIINEQDYMINNNKKLNLENYEAKNNNLSLIKKKGTLSTKSIKTKYSIYGRNIRSSNVKQLSSNNFEEEILSVESQNVENIKFICDNLILAITDLEFLVEYSNKNIKKLEIIYEDENNSDIISEKEIFGIDFKVGALNLYKENNLNYKENEIKKSECNLDVFKFIKYFTRIFETKINLIGKKITLFNDIQQNIPAIIIFDEKKLKQIIFNVLTNALKFSNYGKIGIKLDYNVKSKKLVFNITDTGIGINSDTLKKIGEPYFKLKNNNNDYGIGIGIYLVKQLVESLNGEFKIESVINKGTTVILEFPYNIEEKSKIYQESQINLENNLNKFKNSNISSLITVQRQKNLNSKNLKNTELIFKNLNKFKSKYGIHNDYFENYSKFNSNCNNNYKIFRKRSLEENRRKFKYFSEDFSLKSHKILNKDNKKSYEIANKTSIKDITRTITFDKSLTDSINLNSENKKFFENKNTIFKNKKGSLFNSLVENDSQTSPICKNTEGCLSSFREKFKKNSIISSISNDFNYPKTKLSNTTVNVPSNKNYLYPNYDNSSNYNNIYFINNVSNDDVSKLNRSFDNSSAGETVIVNETFLNTNLNSLKKEQEALFIALHKISKNEKFITFEKDLKNYSTCYRKGEKNKELSNNNINSQIASCFESNLDMNFSLYNNRHRNNNENHSICTNFDNKKKIDDSKIDFTQLNDFERKIHEKDNFSLTMSPKILSEKDNSRMIHFSDIANKYPFEKKITFHDNFPLKDSFDLINNNLINDGQMIIFNENKNSNNLYVITNYEGKLKFHSVNKNSSSLGTSGLNEEIILSSRSIGKIKNKIPNIDINKSCIITKENLRNLSNIIEQINISSKIANNQNGEFLRILIVDDEKLIRQSQINIIKRYSSKKNILIEIEECEDGIECLYKIYKGTQMGIKYNLIITDETMNFMKGSLMAKILKTLITENVIYNIKIFMVTSYGVENYAHLEGIFIDKVYSKPIHTRVIENILNSC